MPRKRRVGLARRRPLTLRDVSIGDQLYLVVGWRPPATAFEQSRTRWLTWEELLTDYVAIRDEFLARWQAHREELMEGLRRTIADRQEAVATNPWDLTEDLLAEAEERLAELERQEFPFAEVVHKAALNGEDPAEAAAAYRRDRHSRSLDADPPAEEPGK